MITPIGHGESNAAIHFAIAMLVVEISMNSHPVAGIGDYFLMPSISLKLQLERHSIARIDLFNTRDRTVLSVLR